MKNRRNKAAAGPADDESTFLARLRARDQRAWHEAFEQLTPLILYWACSSFGVPDQEAEDVCQEVLAIVYLRIDRCKPGSLKGWALGITRKVASNHRRKSRPWLTRWLDAPLERLFPDKLEPPFGPSLDDLLSSRRLLDELSEDQLDVLALCVKGHTRSEISEQLGIPEGTVASRQRLIRKAWKRLQASEGASSSQQELPAGQRLEGAEAAAGEPTDGCGLPVGSRRAALQGTTLRPGRGAPS